jgi:hypothetical protein
MTMGHTSGHLCVQTTVLLAGLDAARMLTVDHHCSAAGIAVLQ